MKECPICVDIMEDGAELCVTPCNHEFHKTCLLSYADFNRDKDSLLCPVCRHAIFERPPPVMEEQPTHRPRYFMEEQPTHRPRYFMEIYGEEFARCMLNTCAGALLLVGLLILLMTLMLAFGHNEEPLP